MRDVKSDSIARLVTRLYALEFGAALIVAGVYKIQRYEFASLVTPAGILALFGAIVVLVSIRPLVRRSALASRAGAIAAAANVMSLLIAFGVAEVTLRVLARETSDGITIAGFPLQPTWPEVVRRNQALIRSTRAAKPYFNYDPELGWTVGPSRRSANGMYLSSAEGLRSAVVGHRYADDPIRPRVALIGDSNAFSMEVPFNDSLGHRLEEIFGPDIQVLNFGVDGYGIDQIYLRYQRDVRPWKPAVVVVVFIEHDLMRTMAVYPFISFGWAGYLVKPRFATNRDDLVVENAPIPSPDEILGVASVDQLPYIDDDPGFNPSSWKLRFDHRPYVLRLLTSAFPRWSTIDEARLANETRALNAQLLKALNESVIGQGSTPIFVHLPRWSGADELTKPTLARAGVFAIDTTECLTSVPADRRRVPSGSHYTGIANDALAHCIAPSIQSALDSRMQATKPPPG